MTHTATPWAHRNGRIFAADRENLTIANVARAADGDYSSANGEFIIKACNAHDELVKALQRAADLLARYPKHDDAWKECRAALAKVNA